MPVGYYHLTDIQKSLQLLLAVGAQIQQEVKDVGGGKLIATVKDPDGNDRAYSVPIKIIGMASR